MGRLSFQYGITQGGVELRLVEKPWIGRTETLPVEIWADRMSNQSFSGLSRILASADDTESRVERRADALFIDDETIASLSEPQALGLGLPPSMRFVLQVSTQNLVTDADFSISYRWIDEANRSLRAERRGALVSVGGENYRLPQPLFSMIEAVDGFSAADIRDDGARMERLARLQALFPQETVEQLSINISPIFGSFMRPRSRLV
ncbi:hypothetical protein QA640_09905 [Bradyrhizobium sp. CB82]|uniref:hypothetical protein n=1 Tax=Bradyrhizobium sp. CB82 TaxID=3039159 RepID=UPI0024B20C6C|nr:hypothetical protein [Bradyrhizobium sp. CB82]WFU42742.1 hypothetical protein QA640_09905 [Bradyrhizobium sp. CB82]